MNCRKKRYSKQPRRSRTPASAHACPARAPTPRTPALFACASTFPARPHVHARLRRPRPIADFRHILAVSLDVMLVFDEFVLELLLQVDALAARLRQAIDGVDHEMEAVDVVQHG